MVSVNGRQWKRGLTQTSSAVWLASAGAGASARSSGRCELSSHSATRSESTNSSVALRYGPIRPGSCEEWAAVQPPWPFSSLTGAPVSGSERGTGGSATGGLAGGGNAGGGPGSGGEAGRRSQLLEVISSLPGRADRIFSDAHGVPYRLRVEATQPATLENEASTRTWLYADVLRPLATLANSWLAAQLSSSAGSSSSSGSATAGGLGLSAPAGPGPSGAGAGVGAAGPFSGGPSGAEAASSAAAAVGSGIRVASVSWALQQKQVGDEEPDEYQDVTGLPDFMLQARLTAADSDTGGAQESSAATSSSGGGGAAGASASGCGAGAQRCVCILEVRTSAVLMKNGQPIPLLDMYRRGNAKAAALVSEVFTCMDCAGAPYGILMGYDVMWPFFCPQLLLQAPPPREQMVLRIGRPILGSTQQPDATFKAATMFMMLCGIEFANSSTGGGVAAAARPAGAPPPGVLEPPAPVPGVFFLATARVRGLTLREVVAQRGRIGPGAAAAAERALQRLHAAAAPGGGRFLHGDVRLSNIMLVRDESAVDVGDGGGGGGGGGQELGAAAGQAAAVSVGAGRGAEAARCVVIDLGHSRLDGRVEEQQAELQELREHAGSDAR
ncbi:hypothetical protein HXX76_004460 [Chlamydomonas incerta]|uniref:Uncharacterized protein n=1 Tax=Chlamydomonas incerta TaxID=51695 RepID=A0A835TK78_CHLIN|nr:hypothetical protein HXX76_004460 [Chlamydomonas incerta]|eukprot:KAG2440355.1 hypothetical protein HXX76_004460 [Chlamydomonas incerta]